MTAIMPSQFVIGAPPVDSDYTRVGWESIRDQSLFVTGGSGFFGRWFLQGLCVANQRWNLNAKAIVLTRDAERFRQQLPTLASDPCLTLHVGDVRTATPPPLPCSYLVHMAGEPHGPVYASDPAGMVTAMVSGAKHILNIARQFGNPRTLLISTGAVYGPQPSLDRIPEDAIANEEPAPSRRAYATGKKNVEDMMLAASNLEVVVARPFAFLGPGLPHDAAFAASQFLNQALSGQTLQVLNGNVTRSYLYASDLAEWLWTLLLRGIPGQAYNVGSETPVTLAELARMVAAQIDVPPAVEVRSYGLSDRYIPSTRKAREAFGLRETVGLEDAVQATVAWRREENHAKRHR